MLRDNFGCVGEKQRNGAAYAYAGHKSAKNKLKIISSKRRK